MSRAFWISFAVTAVLCVVSTVVQILVVTGAVVVK